VEIHTPINYYSNNYHDIEKVNKSLSSYLSWGIKFGPRNVLMDSVFFKITTRKVDEMLNDKEVFMWEV